MQFRKIVRHSYYLLASIFVATTFSLASVSDSETSSGNSFIAGSSSHSNIIINEIYANPVGDEAAAMPNGEWVELYNTGDWSIDVNGWYLYDAHDDHDLPIAPANVAGGSTVIPAHGFLVVFRNTDPLFSLNNSGAETVRLLDGAIWVGALIDSVNYFDTSEGRSWSGMPDGDGVWSDWHTPTPGGANV